MEWWIALLLIMVALFILFSLGIPVALAFLIVNFAGVIVFYGGEGGLLELVAAIRGSLARYTFLPMVLFILMGILLFQSGIAINAIDTMDKWLGRLPGRLGLIAVAGGVLLSTLSGASTASCAVLGSVLTPEMEKRGYKKAMSLGPIMGSGGLAMLIPPSGMAVLVAALGETSVARVLIGGIIPGLMMAFLYAGYIIIRCWLQPSIAPPYDVAPTPLAVKLKLLLKYVLPLGFIIFMVTGVIFMGVATPSEAAATGALATFVLAAAYGKLNWQVVKKTFKETLSISVMILFIVSGAIAFGYILGFSGATRGLSRVLTALPVHPVVLVAILQVILIILGMFAGQFAMIMVVVPLFMPIIHDWGLSPVWFCLLILLNIEMAATTPPYGMILFIMQGVAPPGTKIGDIYRAGLPFLVCDAIAMALMLAFPISVLWLPSLMG